MFPLLCLLCLCLGFFAIFVPEFVRFFCLCLGLPPSLLRPLCLCLGFVVCFHCCKLLRISWSIVDEKQTNLRQQKTVFLSLSPCFFCCICCTCAWVFRLYLDLGLSAFSACVWVFYLFCYVCCGFVRFFYFICCACVWVFHLLCCIRGGFIYFFCYLYSFASRLFFCRLVIVSFQNSSLAVWTNIDVYNR